MHASTISMQHSNSQKNTIYAFFKSLQPIKLHKTKSILLLCPMILDMRIESYKRKTFNTEISKIENQCMSVSRHQVGLHLTVHIWKIKKQNKTITVHCKHNGSSFQRVQQGRETQSNVSKIKWWNKNYQRSKLQYIILCASFNDCNATY